MVRGVAALVTSATGDEGASQRVAQHSAYQPSERQAHFARVRLPRMSDKVCTTATDRSACAKGPLCVSTDR